MNNESNSPKEEREKPKAQTKEGNEGRRTKWILIFGCAVAGAVVIIDPSARTLVYLGSALAAVAGVLLVRRVGARSRLSSLRVSPQVALLVTSVLVCGLGSELSLRLFAFHLFPEVDKTEGLGQNLGYQYDSLLGWFPIPNSRRTFEAWRKVSISHNSKGFRDPEPVFDDKPRIAFVGDSYTWGYDAQVEERFTEKLRTKHPEWRIYNFGVCGYSTDQ